MRSAYMYVTHEGTHRHTQTHMTALPEARVQTHAQSEEECAELPVRESGEVAVCVFIAAGPMIKLCAGSA